MPKKAVFVLLALAAAGGGVYYAATSGQAPKPAAREQSPPPAEASPTPRKSLQEIHQEAIIVDTHVDTVLRMLDKGVRLGVPSRGSVDIPKMKQGGLDVVFFSIWVDPTYGPKSKERADFLIKTVKDQIAANPGDIELATSYADIQRITGAGKIAGLLGIEGGHAIENKLENLDYFHQQGVRYLGLTWSTHTEWADSSGQQPPKWNGLTDFGRQVVRKLNAIGMLVDVSHVSDETFADVMETASKPVIASHSNTRAVHSHPRNLTDPMLQALARNGGVVGINFYPKFLGTGATTIATVADHIDHAFKTAGPDHVGLGSDWDGIEATAAGLEDASKLFSLTQELHKRGYKDDEIRQILGGNFMKVFEQVLK